MDRADERAGPGAGRPAGYHLCAGSGWGAYHGDPLYYHRILPTADLNVPMGMSLGVLLLMFYYGLKIKHPAGFVKKT